MKNVVLITGVSGGIGQATAARFSASGWHVIGIDLKPPSSPHHISRFVQADVADPEVPSRLLSEVTSIEARLDALILNAAVQVCKPLIKTSLEDWDLTMSANVRSAFLFAQASHPLLRQNQGSIVAVSSVHAIATSKGMVAYASSKGALLALIRVMALELAEDAIRVNAVLPGAVLTPMLVSGLRRGHIAAEDVTDSLHELATRHSLGRIGRPEEIAEAILFLADNDRASFITGQGFIIDGGATARLSTE
jgi:NAD(P)-dependent dehydrogenase (short-subunit alcohol dehydrogenase family)